MKESKINFKPAMFYVQRLVETEDRFVFYQNDSIKDCELLVLPNKFYYPHKINYMNIFAI